MKNNQVSKNAKCTELATHRRGQMDYIGTLEGGGGVLLGIIGGGVPPGSPNFRPQNFFFHSRFQ